MRPETFLADLPKLHSTHDKGEPVCWGVDTEVLRFIGETLPEGSVTGETGAGVSTVFFALMGYRHYAVCPEEYVFERIRAYCAGHGISLEKVDLILARSEFYLPQVEIPDLDFMLIDGSHAFPAPFIDWFYTANALKVGGLVAVDDTQLLTGKILSDFLEADHHWKTVKIFRKTAIFRKLHAQVLNDGWGEQHYLKRALASKPAQPNTRARSAEEGHEASAGSTGA